MGDIDATINTESSKRSYYSRFIKVFKRKKLFQSSRVTFKEEDNLCEVFEISTDSLNTIEDTTIMEYFENYRCSGIKDVISDDFLPESSIDDVVSSSEDDPFGNLHETKVDESPEFDAVVSHDNTEDSMRLNCNNTNEERENMFPKDLPDTDDTSRMSIDEGDHLLSTLNTSNIHKDDGGPLNLILEDETELLQARMYKVDSFVSLGGDSGVYMTDRPISSLSLRSDELLSSIPDSKIFNTAEYTLAEDQEVPDQTEFTPGHLRKKTMDFYPSSISSHSCHSTCDALSDVEDDMKSISDASQSAHSHSNKSLLMEESQHCSHGDHDSKFEPRNVEDLFDSSSCDAGSQIPLSENPDDNAETTHDVTCHSEVSNETETSMDSTSESSSDTSSSSSSLFDDSSSFTMSTDEVITQKLNTPEFIHETHVGNHEILEDKINIESDLGSSSCFDASSSSSSSSSSSCRSSCRSISRYSSSSIEPGIANEKIANEPSITNENTAISDANIRITEQQTDASESASTPLIIDQYWSEGEIDKSLTKIIGVPSSPSESDLSDDCVIRSSDNENHMSAENVISWQSAISWFEDENREYWNLHGPSDSNPSLSSTDTSRDPASSDSEGAALDLEGLSDTESKTDETLNVKLQQQCFNIIELCDSFDERVSRLVETLVDDKPNQELENIGAIIGTNLLDTDQDENMMSLDNTGTRSLDKISFDPTLDDINSSSSEYFSAAEDISPDVLLPLVKPSAPRFSNFYTNDVALLQISSRAEDKQLGKEIKLHPWLLEYFTETELQSVQNILENWGGYRLVA